MVGSAVIPARDGTIGLALALTRRQSQMKTKSIYVQLVRNLVAVV
jgi:hypothetical protein